MEKNFCDTLSTIPQFGGTCWFNAMLMVIFYSQNSRKVLLKLVNDWDKKNKFLMICKNILLKYYIFSKNANVFFNKFKPEIILFYMLKFFEDNILKENLKNSIKMFGYNKLGWRNHYLHNIYKHLGVNCLDITYVNESNKYLLNIYKHINYKFINNQAYIDINLDKVEYIDEYDEIVEIINDVPDVLLFTDSNLSAAFIPTINLVHNKILEKNEGLQDINNADIHTTIEGLFTYEDNIKFNGKNYKLDSCLLGNYNKTDKNSSHLVCGLTCENQRYVYNGWDKVKTQEEIEEYGDESFIACPLIKFNWSLKENKPFCFSKNKCTIKTKLYPDRFCFSFDNLSNGTLIYVLNDDKNKNVNKKDDIDISSLSLTSDFPDMIEDMHDIQKLSEDQLIEQLKAFEVEIDYEEDKPIPTKKDLQKMLYDNLRNYFNVKEKLKRERDLITSNSGSSLSSKRKLKKYKV